MQGNRRKCRNEVLPGSPRNNKMEIESGKGNGVNGINGDNTDPNNLNGKESNGGRRVYNTRLRKSQTIPISEKKSSRFDDRSPIDLRKNSSQFGTSRERKVTKSLSFAGANCDSPKSERRSIIQVEEDHQEFGACRERVVTKRSSNSGANCDGYNSERRLVMEEEEEEAGESRERNVTENLSNVGVNCDKAQRKLAMEEEEDMEEEAGLSGERTITKILSNLEVHSDQSERNEADLELDAADWELEGEEEREEEFEEEEESFDIKEVNEPVETLVKKKEKSVSEIAISSIVEENPIPTLIDCSDPPVTVADLPEIPPFPETHEKFPETQSRMQNLVDMVMWRDISRSAFVFGSGSFLLISSSYTKDLNFSLISAISYVGLLYLAAVFFSRSILCRGVMDSGSSKRIYDLGEEDAIWLLKLVLPYVNEILLKLRELFSGDPATTMKLGVLLFVLARCGSSITIWTLARIAFFGLFTIPKVYSSYSVQLSKYGRFWFRRFRDAWNSCSHKKAVAIAAFMVLWNLSSVVARIWAAFILIVAVRYYQQSLITVNWDEVEVRMCRPIPSQKPGPLKISPIRKKSQLGGPIVKDAVKEKRKGS
ncbi:hypothetical protein AMTRI_Chr12g239490 [Amborella trichopoda]